ncbi:hypothetical protein B7982_04450 [Fibrobacter sp. UWB2]|jgi:hypothetical protein|uniref:FtsK gamma domain-containing protein n=1 Tax=Fibrobacter succinogenes TaxID=833 RepID=A0A380RWX9_FIBSU|nr:MULTISPECIES: hypothetical protein [Fibrobacter]OWV23688.1 hypothetical protein B7982_04450 [Fibrobacter sp. UWB2]PWJ37667.1 hypothetical protein IE02_1158 [Fibrobacter succinogenes subsp. elongatus]SUQ19914.1 hypothetical protein SAMN05661053_1158 [Fibrobacter succinogenes]
MESLLIFIAIFVIDALIKRASAKKKALQDKQRNEEDYDSTANEEFDENEQPSLEPSPSANRKLQEYIKQFEEAQREAAQGTMESPMPPPIPENYHRLGDQVTMREVAEDIVQQGFVDIDYLKIEFEVSEARAIELINELQQHRIIGRDMGDGAYDVLVQDIDELNNLLSHEQKAEAVAQTSAAKSEQFTSPAASDKQSQLKILEERARKAREEADEAARRSDLENGYTGDPAEIAESLTKRTAVRSISRESVRRGFIWGKVIDEPRFKKRWTAYSR